MKPFSIGLLRKTVLNLIRNREQLRNAFSGRQNQEEQISIPEIKSPNDRLMERVMRVINENLSDEVIVTVIATGFENQSEPLYHSFNSTNREEIFREGTDDIDNDLDIPPFLRDRDNY